MADRISYKIDVDVAGELKETIKRSVTVEGYAKIEAGISKKEEGDAGKATLRPLPGAGGQIDFLLITSNIYDKNIKINKKSDDSEVVVLSAPIALFGPEAVSHLEIPDTNLELINETDQDVSVQLIVGWDAVDS